MNLLKDNKSCWILDGYGIFFQSFYGIKTELNSNGTPTNAVYGSLRAILKIINEYNPDYLFVALDTGGRTFRDSLYEDFLEAQFIKNILKIGKNKIEQGLVDLMINKKISPNDLILKLGVSSDRISEILSKFSMKDINIPIILIAYFNLENEIQISKEKSPYKANRKETPDALKVQFPIFFEMLDAIGVSKISCNNYEADDVIATISRIFQDKKPDVFIGSSDKDLMQLINHKTTIFNFRQKDFITEAKFLKKFNFESKYFIEYLSLIGDKADNVPGVYGMGEKNATNIIRKYKTIENFFSSNPDVTELKTKDLILNNFEIFNLSKSLIKLEDYIDIDIDIDKEFKLNHDTLRDFSKKYNFK